MMKQRTIGLSILLLTLSGCFAATTTNKGNKVVTTASGLQYVIEKEGAADGPVAKKGDIVTVHYTGCLDDAGKKGKKFDSSRDRNQAFTFALGAGQVIKGWDEGVAGMKKGEIRCLTIPAELGYGSRGYPGVIPGGATLVFEVELISIKS
jgi:peptidylprolyl isomerase